MFFAMVKVFWQTCSHQSPGDPGAPRPVRLAAKMTPLTMPFQVHPANSQKKSRFQVQMTDIALSPVSMGSEDRDMYRYMYTLLYFHACTPVSSVSIRLSLLHTAGIDGVSGKQPSPSWHFPWLQYLLFWGWVCRRCRRTYCIFAFCNFFSLCIIWKSFTSIACFVTFHEWIALLLGNHDGSHPFTSKIGSDLKGFSKKSQCQGMIPPPPPLPQFQPFEAEPLPQLKDWSVIHSRCMGWNLHRFA